MSSQLSNGPLALALVLTPRARGRDLAASVIAGMRPLAGAITSEVRRDGVPRSSQCGGGEVAEPTAPALAVLAVSRSNSALSVASCFSASPGVPRTPRR